ncbi:hypothetical protein MCAMS1_02059 [biofilm metagenome]
MIYQVKGDILLSKAQAIVIYDPMDEGLALQLRTKYPLLQKEFNLWCYQHDTKLGEAWLWQSSDNARIVNLITHESVQTNANHHYYKATLNHVRHALTELAKIIRFKKLISVALPKLGTGSGDLDWDDVWPLVANNLDGLGIPVYLYAVYCPGQAAQEPQRV